MPHKKKFTMRKKIAVPKEKLIYVERFFFSLDAICRLNKIISLFIEEGWDIHQSVYRKDWNQFQ